MGISLGVVAVVLLIGVCLAICKIGNIKNQQRFLKLSLKIFTISDGHFKLFSFFCFFRADLSGSFFFHTNGILDLSGKSSYFRMILR